MTELDANLDISDVGSAVRWLEQTLPLAVRRLMDTDDLDMPLLQLPLAQLRLAHALYSEDDQAAACGETMRRLSEKLGVKQNALTQAADRLVNHTLAERLSDDADRRLVRIRLTSEGRELVAARKLRRRARLSSVFAALNNDDKTAFLEAVSTLDSIANRTAPLYSDAYPKSEENRGLHLQPAAPQGGDQEVI